MDSAMIIYRNQKDIGTNPATKNQDTSNELPTKGTNAKRQATSHITPSLHLELEQVN